MDYISKAEMTSKLEDILDSGWGRKRINRALRAIIEQSKVPYDGRNTEKARLSRRRVLRFIEEAGEATIPQLAEELETSYTYAQKVMGTLVQDGLVLSKGTKRRRKGQKGKPPAWYIIAP